VRAHYCGAGTGARAHSESLVLQRVDRRVEPRRGAQPRSHDVWGADGRICAGQRPHTAHEQLLEFVRRVGARRAWAGQFVSLWLQVSSDCHNAIFHVTSEILTVLARLTGFRLFTSYRDIKREHQQNVVHTRCLHAMCPL